MNKLSILVAEDEVLTRLDIKEMIEEAGHIVCGEASNGSVAIEMAKEKNPDLAIIDIMMPGLQGLEVAKMLNVMNIPVIILTAYSQQKYINRAEKVAVFGYLIKPIKEQDLLPAIQIAYGRWKEMQNIKTELENVNNKLQAQKIISRAKALLACYNGISEFDAHQKLMQEAMNQRVPILNVAMVVIAELGNKKPANSE